MSNVRPLVTTTEAFIVGACVIGAFELFVTFRLVFARAYTVKQKVLQALLVWLVPVIGAILVSALMDSDSVKSRPMDTAFTPDGGNNPGGMGPDNGHG